VSGRLRWAEAVLDAADVAAPIEARLPTGGRPRQLSVRTLLVGMLLAAADGRPAHLVRVHRALVGLAVADRRRLGVEVQWRRGRHTLTYRQVERTFGLVVGVLDATGGDGAPSEELAALTDELCEASVPTEWKEATTALAVDWSDLETWALAPRSDGVSADRDASWGRRGPTTIFGGRDELFFGYHPQVATMVREEHGPPVPELVRRVLLTSCKVDPPPAFVAVLERMATAGVAIGDVLADSGYAHRVASRWALPLRRLGARLVVDLHPSDRGPKGTHAGAVIANGNCYCPATPPALLTLTPPAPRAGAADLAAHDAKTAEAARYKLGRISAPDADGFHRVSCPALAHKLRCPLRPASMNLPFDRPEVTEPPPEPPRCCVQQTVTVPPEVNAKTAQAHDYPSAAHRASYARRTGSERAFSTIKDSATTDIGRGWCRVMGLTAITLFFVCAVVARNERVHAAFQVRQAENERRAAAGLPPKTRRRRRRTIGDLVASAAPP